MKQLVFILLSGIVILFSACGGGLSFQTDKYLAEAEQEAFKYSIIRYVGALPKKANVSNKFDKQFDETYRLQAAAMKLDKYYPNSKDGYIYFEVSRIAPSFYERYVATGGRLKRDNDGTIMEYEEIYRTWKMERGDLEKKTALFFEYMAKGKDLSPFYTANIGDTEHIEFPDERTYFDKEERRWNVISPNH